MTVHAIWTEAIFNAPGRIAQAVVSVKAKHASMVFESREANSKRWQCHLHSGYLKYPRFPDRPVASEGLAPNSRFISVRRYPSTKPWP